MLVQLEKLKFVEVLLLLTQIPIVLECLLLLLPLHLYVMETVPHQLAHHVLSNVKNVKTKTHLTVQSVMETELV